LFFNNFNIDRKNLTSSVRKAMGKHEEIPVYVQADRDISYGKVIEIVDEIKQAGVRYVAMATQNGR
ncbi:MAG: biopolymer transporter ExbD, partial [Candidatus Babeliales bacterium]